MLQDLRLIMTHCTFDHGARTVRAEISVRLLGTKHRSKFELGVSAWDFRRLCPWNTVMN